MPFVTSAFLFKGMVHPKNKNCKNSLLTLHFIRTKPEFLLNTKEALKNVGGKANDFYIIVFVLNGCFFQHISQYLVLCSTKERNL